MTDDAKLLAEIDLLLRNELMTRYPLAAELVQRARDRIATLEREINYMMAKFAQHALELERQLAEADACAEDADRYRWLRQRGVMWPGSEDGWRPGGVLDRAIDAALAKEIEK